MAKDIEDKLKYYFNKCVEFYRMYPLLSAIVGLLIIVVIGSLWSWDALAAAGTIGAVVVSLYLANKPKKQSELYITNLRCYINAYALGTGELLSEKYSVSEADGHAIQSNDMMDDMNFGEFKVEFLVENKGQIPLVINSVSLRTNLASGFTCTLTNRLDSQYIGGESVRNFREFFLFAPYVSLRYFERNMLNDDSFRKHFIDSSQLIVELADGRNLSFKFDKVKVSMKFIEPIK